MRVLVVEDEKKLREILKAGLEAENFVVDEAPDGEAGSYMARTNNYDVIILDNILPKKLGKDVCTDIRADGKSTPIIILSVKSETTSKIDLLNAGADDYMIKPFSFDELIARMRALMRRPHAVEAEVLKAGNITLDTKNQIAKIKGREVYLTKKEYMLLEYLVANRGAVVSRGMILEHVWDMNADPFSNTIEAHILSLRRKLGQDKKVIHTVPGRGYKAE